MISLSAACQRKLHQSTLRSLISWALGDIELYLLVISASFLVVSDSLQPHGLQPWNSPGKSTGVGCHTFWQGIFPTQRSNPGLPHCRQILYLLNHQGSLKKYPHRSPNFLPESHLPETCSKPREAHPYDPA